jgi:hypothetical protein
MMKRYGHIGQIAQRQAVAVLDAKPSKKGSKSKTKRHARKNKLEQLRQVPAGHVQRH